METLKVPSTRSHVGGVAAITNSVHPPLIDLCLLYSVRHRTCVEFG